MRWVRRMAALALLAMVAWWGAVLSGDFDESLLEKSAATALVIRDGEGAILRQEATSAGLRENWIGLEEISPHLIHATLASEDNDFRDHGGVDWTALTRATWLNIRGGEVAYGGSTITMQLVRLSAGTRRNLWGKLKQTVLAARLERQLSKDEILEQYLNRVYYGNGAWGAQQAAQLYFDKNASELSVGEASLLAVFPRGPSFYNPFRHWKRAIQRRKHILGLMQSHGYLDAEDRGLAERTPISVLKKRPNFRAPHFSEFVKTRLPKDFAAGSEVKTTLDYALQRHVEVAVSSHVDTLAGRNLTQAAVVVLRNSDGAILSMVGSRDYYDADHQGAYNGTTARLRPGSTLKPFVYAAAMEKGDTPATMAYDLALPKDAHQFYTKDVKSHGFARYRESLAGSYNLSAVHTLQRVGIPATLDKLRKAGLWTLDKPDEEYDWGLAIGHAEVRLLDLTAAFSTFGRGGVPLKVRAIEEARHIDGESYREPAEEGERVFSEEVAYQIFDILSDPDARKPMFGDRVPMNLPFPVALKTGTTKAYTDLWAVGTTAEYTVGVWGGNFDGSPTHQVMSLQGATPLMRAVYTAIAARYGDPTAPSRPETIVTAEVCPLSGKLPGPHCDHHKTELFVSGRLPQESCDWHQVVCDEKTIVYPKVLWGWVDFYGLRKEPVCGETEEPGTVADGVRIVAPVSGAHFLLEEHRPAIYQKPPLAAVPARSDLEWFIDDQPASEWVPSRGEHRVRVARGDSVDEITIVYE
jgi:penicillin-binding protein 1C